MWAFLVVVTKEEERGVVLFAHVLDGDNVFEWQNLILTPVKLRHKRLFQGVNVFQKRQDL